MEHHPLRPRSASENCVSSRYSSTPEGRPQIIIFKPRGGEGEAEGEEQGATTSSSDRSPDIHTEGVEDGKFFTSLSNKSSPHPSCTSQSDNEDTQAVTSSPTLVGGDEGDSGLEGSRGTPREDRILTDKHLRLPLPSVRHRSHCRKGCELGSSGKSEIDPFAERWKAMSRCHRPPCPCCGAVQVREDSVEVRMVFVSLCEPFHSILITETGVNINNYNYNNSVFKYFKLRPIQCSFSSVS